MLDKILNFAEKYAMFPCGSTVICGLSGGADSVCLLVSLFRLREKLGLNSIEALHVNHCIRGDESDRDENFCRELCRTLGIKFTAVSCNVPEYAKEHSVSIEEAARKLRYNAFAEHSCGRIIATAHNADDNLETAVLNLARGTALKGLAGIPPVRGNIVRPLLTVSREEIENFLSENHISFVTDSSNLSDDYTRNKIRHGIIPIMKNINSSAIETSAASMDALREENSFIETEADNVFKACFADNSLSGISAFHPVIRKRCIAKLLSMNNLPYSYDRLAAADEIALSCGKINVSKDIYLVSDGSSISLQKIIPRQESNISAVLEIGDNSIFPGITLCAEIISGNIPELKKFSDTKANVYYLDYDKISGSAVVRNRRFGDRIRLCGNSFTSSVKKLINEKIQPAQRPALHFIEDASGTILAEKIGIAQSAAPDKETVRYLKITICRAENSV